MTMLPLAFLAAELCLVAVFIKFYYSVRSWICSFAAAAALGAMLAGVLHAVP